MKGDKIDIDHPFFMRGCCRIQEGENKVPNFKSSCAKLDCHNWLKNIDPAKTIDETAIVEVRFKNSKKEFFKVLYNLKLREGDIVAVESSPGHDIGIVCLTGPLVLQQMKRKKSRLTVEDMKKVYRRARLSDIEKWISAVENENDTLFKTRKIAGDMDLDMKVNDIEYQGDGTKAIFYYTAEERVDFRQLIKVLAEKFRVRIEMKQIGARQEAARVGGIGSCGRELCCATWVSNFKSVTTNNARTQQLSLNPSKLAGQCSKLKCCLNFENSAYLEALKKFPDQEVVLKSKKGMAEYQKADVFKEIVWYSYMEDHASMMAIPLEKAQKIIEMNKKNKLPDNIEEFAVTLEQKADYENGSESDDFYRFDEDEIY